MAKSEFPIYHCHDRGRFLKYCDKRKFRKHAVIGMGLYGSFNRMVMLSWASLMNLLWELWILDVAIQGWH